MNSPERRPEKKPLAAIIGAVVAAILLLVIAGGIWWLKSEFEQPKHNTKPSVVLFEKGTSGRAIAEALEGKGLITDTFRFRVALRLFGAKKPLRAGEYEIPANASPAAIVRILQDGEQVVHKLTFAEGLTVREIADELRATANLDGPLPDALPLEGSLLPETYHYHHGDKKSDILKRMRTAMADTLDRLWTERDRSVPLTSKEQALILASIVEKETGVASERPKVAAVFLNRIKKGMRLQSDPTVVYGLTGGKAPLGRALSRKDLEQPTPYNTYQIDGLPPGPIANPGRASIAAVVNPAATDDLYFVADGTGGHAFSRTLDEHNRNVRKWRALHKGND